MPLDSIRFDSIQFNSIWLNSACESESHTLKSRSPSPDSRVLDRSKEEKYPVAIDIIRVLLLHARFNLDVVGCRIFVSLSLSLFLSFLFLYVCNYVCICSYVCIYIHRLEVEIEVKGGRMRIED
jgi:hypothetical protein